MQTTFNKLRSGCAFQFEIDGPVFVRCRGGFRLGCGGQLHACRPSQIVFTYSV